MRDAGVTPSDAVAWLLELTRKSALEELVGDHCWHTACCFLEMVARTAPQQQSKLIAFLHCLRSVTLSDPTTNEPLRLDNSDGVVWRDLPTFGYTIADDLGSFGKFFQAIDKDSANLVQMAQNKAILKKRLSSGRTGQLSLPNLTLACQNHRTCWTSPTRGRSRHVIGLSAAVIVHENLQSLLFAQHAFGLSTMRTNYGPRYQTIKQWRILLKAGIAGSKA